MSRRRQLLIMGAAAAPGFVPTSVSGLALWLPSYRGIHVDTFGTNSTLSVVKRFDQSGNGHHWTMGTSTQCLIYAPTAGVDGLPTLQTGTVAATSRYVTGPCGSLNTSGLSIFLRIQPSSVVAGTKTFLSCDNNNIEYDCDADHTKLSPYYGAYFTPTAPGAFYTPNNPISTGVVSDGSGGTHYRDFGTVLATRAATSYAFSTLCTGNFMNSPSYLVDALWGDLFLYSRALTASEIVRAMTYVNTPALWKLGPNVVFDGNSLVSGTGASVFTAKGPIVAQSALADLSWHGVNIGKSGQTTTDMITRGVATIDPLYDARRPKNILVAWEIHNELYAGTSASTALANWATYVAARRAAGFKVMTKTVTPVTRVGVPVGYEAARQTVNSALRAGIPGIYGDYIADVGATGNGIGAPGDSDGANYSDKEHLNDAGYAIDGAITAAAILAAA